MPMMLDHHLESSNMISQGQTLSQIYYGHPRRQATKCGHSIHPSASGHTPLCPTCATSQVNTTMNTALEELIAEGGLVQPVHTRSQRWQRAKLRYEIVKQRQAKSRSRDQLREEREQAWDDAHQQYGYRQAAATPQPPAGCSICVSMVARFPTKFLRMQAEREVTWWERPGGLVVDHVLVPRTPPRRVRVCEGAQETKGSSRPRSIIQEYRRAQALSNAQRQTRETRHRTESAVRRKYSLGEDYHFPPEFWDAPLSAHLSRQSYQTAKEKERMAARRARGNVPRPRPPHSALSYSECSDEIKLDESELEHMCKAEKMESLERKARRVGEEVGYLYFVGDGFDGLYEWREDFLRSDRQLIYRNASLGSGSDTGEFEADSEESEDSFEEMDMDE